MKKIIFGLLLIFSCLQVSYSQISTKTKNKIKVKFFAATDSYDNKEYKDVLDHISEIEKLTNGVNIPTALNLKIKALVKLNKFVEAKKALDVLEGLELDDDIIKDMAQYSTTISKKYKEQEDEIKRKKEKARLDSIQAEKDRIARIIAKEAKEEDERNWKMASNSNTLSSYRGYLNNDKNVKYRSEARTMINRIIAKREKEEDERNWEMAVDSKTVEGYKIYLNNENNKLYRREAQYRIKGIFWKQVIDANNIVTAAKEYLEGSDITQDNKRRAEKFIKYANITKLEVDEKSWGISVKDQNGNVSNGRELWKNLGYLVNLKSLHIKSAVKEKKLYFYCLRKLETLTIEKNAKVSFNATEKLVDLKEYVNKSKNTSSGFFNLKTLEKVEAENVTEPQLKQIFANLTGLTDLKIRVTRPVEENIFDGIKNLKNLKNLTIFDQKGKFSEAIGDLTNLEYLHFANSKHPISLPENFGKLVNLKEVNLSYSIILALPNSLGNLTNLKRLNLEYSKISTLPESFGKLKNLEKLELRGSSLISLPRSFTQLTNLKTLDVYTPKLDKGKLWRNKEVRKVIKQLQKANPDLNLISN